MDFLRLLRKSLARRYFSISDIVESYSRPNGSLLVAFRSVCNLEKNDLN